MFKRIFHEEWTTTVPIIAFILTFSIFLIIFVRAIRMKKNTRDYLSRLPLQDNTSES
jgi:hypothetical protein